MIQKGIYTITFDVSYNQDMFDPEFQFQLCWHDPTTGVLIYDDPAFFSVEPISEQKICSLESSNQLLPSKEKWKVQVNITYEDAAINPHSDNLKIFEFDQDEGCVVEKSESMTVDKIEHREFQLESSQPSRNRKKPKASKVKRSTSTITKLSTGKAIILAIALLIFSFIGAAILTVISMIYIDPINSFLSKFGYSVTATSLGKFLPAFLAFGFGSYLGTTLGGKLLTRCGVATSDEVRRVMRFFTRRR